MPAHRSLQILSALAVPVALAGCYMRVSGHDRQTNPDANSSTPPTVSTATPHTTPDAPPATMEACQGARCSSVSIWVLYSLNQDLGAGHTVVVEAFDNRYFEGAPAASATVTGFNATAPGEHGSAELNLAPGKYYLRAFLASDAGVTAPYEYGGMRLVTNRPVGYFGAASGPQTLNVPASGESLPPITISLDYLFKAPESDTPSDANLRMIFKVAEGKTVEIHRKLRVELRDTTDMGATPKAVYDLPSDTLLISGRLGTGEFVARNLTPGKYTVLAYVDSNGNGFVDDGELQQSYKQSGSTAFLNIATNRTETATLILE